MRINKDYILRNIVGEYVLVPTGKATQDINGMIHLSEAGGFIWKLYDQKNSLEEIIDVLMEEYEVDRETAERDVYGYSKVLFDNNLIFDVPEFTE
ncbi:MAG: PqqD family protein [Eubacteriales bacterium]|nr:PqqD family protein [Eubacteriales bacterium]